MGASRMTRRAGSAVLPLHGGQVPRWLADRMTRLGAVMSEAIVHHYGRDELLRRLKGRNSDTGVTNIRNVKSPHWRHWLGIEHRCVVPFTSFSENEALPDASKPPVWFAFDETRPLAFFAGLWTNWTSVRKVKEGKTPNDLFGFLTT